MRKFLLALLVVGLLCSPVFAASPTIEEGNRIQFTAADQETSGVYLVNVIVWASAYGSTIVNTDVLNIEDGAGVEILKIHADTASAPPIIIPTGGIKVSGIKVEDLPNGYVTIYGERK